MPKLKLLRKDYVTESRNMKSCECFKNFLNLRSQKEKKKKKRGEERKKVSFFKIGFNNIEILGNLIFFGVAF